MLELSDEPKRLVSTFLTYRNDIDIYTEDEPKDKEFYRVLFNRLIDKKIKIYDVTPLGGRTTVIKQCENEPENGRKKIFIIDGDVSIIHGNIPSLKNLFVLEAYCIENFVFDRESIINFIYLQCATKPKEEIKNELDFENWLNNYTNSLIDLFIHFGIINSLGGIYTLFNINKFCVGNIFSQELVNIEIEKLKVYILTLTNPDEYKKIYKVLKIQWTNCIENFMAIVSGKDYLIPILLLKTKDFKKSKALPTNDETKFLLLMDCNLDRLFNLKSAIESQFV